MLGREPQKARLRLRLSGTLQSFSLAAALLSELYHYFSQPSALSVRQRTKLFSHSHSIAIFCLHYAHASFYSCFAELSQTTSHHFTPATRNARPISGAPHAITDRSSTRNRAIRRTGAQASHHASPPRENIAEEAFHPANKAGRRGCLATHTRPHGI